LTTSIRILLVPPLDFLHKCDALRPQVCGGQANVVEAEDTDFGEGHRETQKKSSFIWQEFIQVEITATEFNKLGPINDTFCITESLA